MSELGERILAEARKEEEAMVSFLMELASLESPSDVPESQLPVQALLTRSLEELGFRHLLFSDVQYRKSNTGRQIFRMNGS